MSLDALVQLIACEFSRRSCLAKKVLICISSVTPEDAPEEAIPHILQDRLQTGIDNVIFQKSCSCIAGKTLKAMIMLHEAKSFKEEEKMRIFQFIWGTMKDRAGLVKEAYMVGGLRSILGGLDGSTLCFLLGIM